MLSPFQIKSGPVSEDPEGGDFLLQVGIDGTPGKSNGLFGGLYLTALPLRSRNGGPCLGFGKGLSDLCCTLSCLREQGLGSEWLLGKRGDSNQQTGNSNNRSPDFLLDSWR